MSQIVAALDDAVDAVVHLRNTRHKGTNRQVRNADERARVRATAYTWFNNYRPLLVGYQNEPAFKNLDKSFADLRGWADQNTVRQKYRDLLLSMKGWLVELRSTRLLVPVATEPSAPQFASLISDAKMLEILQRRWKETMACRGANAPLAATVMLGGLLEALFLVRINRMQDKAPLYIAGAAPRDKAGKTRSLKEWRLKDFLDVAKELGWIRQSAKDVGEVLRDYRNYIHPEKELSEGFTVDANDISMFIRVFGSIADQIIASVK